MKAIVISTYGGPVLTIAKLPDPAWPQGRWSSPSAEPAGRRGRPAGS